jgi:hypothetical protein
MAVRQFTGNSILVWDVALVVERVQIFERALATPGTVFATCRQCVRRLSPEGRILRDSLGATRRGEGRGEAMKIPGGAAGQ